MADYYERDLVQDLGDRFARNARARRLLMRQSQVWVATFMREVYGFQWHQTVVAKVEKGERAVKLDEAFALARVYGLDLDDLLRGGRGLELIRNGAILLNMERGVVSVYPKSSGEPDGPISEIKDLLLQGEDMLDEEGDDGEHPQA